MSGGQLEVRLGVSKFIFDDNYDDDWCRQCIAVLKEHHKHTSSLFKSVNMPYSS